MDDLYRLSDSLHSKYHYIGTVQNNKFHCPYCGKWKENEDMGYREEVVDSSFDFPWYLPNQVKITSYKRDMPICSSCLSCFVEASEKATHWSLIIIAIFLAIDFALCFFSENREAFLGLLIVKIPLFFLVRFIIRYFLIKKKGIKYHVRKY